MQFSDCCQAEVVEEYKDNPRDHHDSIPIYICSECKEECDIDEDHTDQANAIMDR